MRVEANINMMRKTLTYDELADAVLDYMNKHYAIEIGHLGEPLELNISFIVDISKRIITTKCKMFREKSQEKT